MYSRRLKLWAKVAGEAIGEGESFEAVKERIFENDEEIRRAGGYLKLHRGSSLNFCAHQNPLYVALPLGRLR